MSVETDGSFALRVRVEPADLDEQDHVNNVVYVRWVQDAALAHWRALTTAEIQAAVGWALLRHEIDYRAPARLGDEVVVRTRVGHLEGLTFERLTTVERADGRRLAESRTLWCPIDPQSGPPRAGSSEVAARCVREPREGDRPNSASPPSFSRA